MIDEGKRKLYDQRDRTSQVQSPGGTPTPIIHIFLLPEVDHGEEQSLGYLSK